MEPQWLSRSLVGGAAMATATVVVVTIAATATATVVVVTIAATAATTVVAVTIAATAAATTLFCLGSRAGVIVYLFYL